MNKADEHKKDPSTAAALELASLNKQVERVRAELRQLQDDVAEAESRLRSAQANHQLREANERLVIATLRAQSDAETAAQALNEVSRSIEIDALTGLPNRAVLLERLTRASVEAKFHRFQLAVLFVDLNGFKQVNDTLGHAVGDQVLKHAAQGLASSVRAADTVSRYGGDEFLILLNDISRADAAMVAGRVVEVLAFPVRIGEEELRLTASVGISFFPDDGDDANALVDRADTAMCRAKRLGQGGGSYAFYVEEPTGTGHRSSVVDLTFPRVMDSDPAATQPARHADLKEANEQLVLAAIGAQELRAAAEKAQLRQTEFLAVIAHELRNPLSPILAAAQSLGQGGANETLVPRARAIIERQVAHMSRLLNDLLDLSRVTTGKFTLERQIVEMSDLVSDAIETCRHSVDARSQRVSVHKPSCALEVNGDPARLTQIFVNLVDNASKYTPDNGEINLMIEVVDDAIVLTLSDTGIGITADALPDVFEPFVQDAQAIAFNDAGLGIGLTVVRELVEAHSGTVIARSAGSGLGSQFVVTLPLARSA